MRKRLFVSGMVAVSAGFSLLVIVNSGHLLHLPTLYAAPQTETIINGAQHPELIPDERAYHMVVLIASASERSTSLAHRRAHAFVVNFPMSNQDQVAFGNLAQQYRKSLEQIQDEQRAILSRFSVKWKAGVLR